MNCTIKPIRIGTSTPTMLPQKFMLPPSTPALDLPPRMAGRHQYIPHQRMKNSATHSSAMTRAASGVYATSRMHSAATAAEPANMLRITVFGWPPLAFHLSEIQPPISSPIKPHMKIRKVAPPMALISRLWAWCR
ncbi:hypothetical protein D3C80_1384420 [compost metagenome]